MNNSKKKCSVRGCQKPSRYVDLCTTHYYRDWRAKRDAGLTQKRAKAEPDALYNKGGGYLGRSHKKHPASPSSGTLYEHRRIFFEAYGGDGHSCHWCAAPLEWGGRHRTKVYIDHLDADRQNNALSNLVAACCGCNMKRGAAIIWLTRFSYDPGIIEMLKSR